MLVDVNINMCYILNVWKNYFAQCFKILNTDKNTIIAPEGLSRFYKNGFYGEVVSSWMTKEDRLNEINDYILYLDTLIEELLKIHALIKN